MVWIRADYEFASLFSYRIPDFSSQYAISSILPGPSAIKLAIVSTAIEITGNVEYGKEIFEIIKNSSIKIKLPRKIASTNVLIKRLKKKKEKSGLETTFGIRGYVHYPENFSIYTDIPENKVTEVERILKSIRYFGTSDSLVWCRRINKEEPPNNAISAVENLKKEDKNILIISVKDINPKANFDEINIYKKINNRKDILIKKIYPIPISKQFKGKNWIVYEFD
jgi:CRISPR/Cas system-associated protein Cas5 (RAMP superfamily)